MMSAGQGQFGQPRPIPEQFAKLSEAAANRVEGFQKAIRMLDGNVAALTDPKLRKRCREAQAGLLRCCEGISLAERERTKLYRRNSPMLGQLVANEVAGLQAASVARGEQGMLASGTLRRVELDQEGAVWLAAGRAVVESDAWMLSERGKPVLDADSVQARVIEIAATVGITIQKAQRATIREGELARFSPNWGGKRDLAEIITTKEKTAEIRAMGWDKALKFIDDQLSAAMEADPPDLKFAEDLELAARPVITEMLQLGSRKLDAEIGGASGGTMLRNGTLLKLYERSTRCLKTWDDLRQGRVMPDLEGCAVLLDVMGQLWGKICGASCLEFYDSYEIQDLLQGRGVTKGLSERQWQVDPAWLLRGSQPVAMNAAFRAIPTLREAVRAFDAKTLRAMRAGKTRSGGQP